MTRRATIGIHLMRLVLAVTLPLAGVVAWNLYATARADSQFARQQVLHLAQVIASETARFLDRSQEVLNRLAARPAIRSLDPARCDPILQEHLAFSPRYANAVTMSMDGSVVCSAVPLERPTRGDPERFIKLMRAPDQLTIGKAGPGVVTGRWVLPIGRPLLDAQGASAGAVVLPLDLLTLPVLPSLEGLPANAVVGIIAGDGTVLAHPEKGLIGTNQIHHAVVRLMLRDRNGTAEGTGIDGTAQIQGFITIRGTDWVAAASIPSREVYAGVNARIATSALISIVILSAALLLAARWSREIRAPIAALADAANEAAAGHFSLRAPAGGVTEIAKVALQFNHLLDAVGQSNAERDQAEVALRANAASLEGLTRRLLEAQEAERRTIARELHDEVGGVLTAVKLNLLSLQKKVAGAERDATFADSLGLVDGAIQSVRSLSVDLRPAVLDDLGLIPALRWYCERQAQRADIAIDLALEAIDLKSAHLLESACFRIVQESITNALRHANAGRIRVALRLTDGGFVLEIADDGRGFEVAAARRQSRLGKSSGLLGMEERAKLTGGRLRIDSTLGAGTRVRVEFDVPEDGFD